MIQRHRLSWYGHVLRKDENDWVKKCTDFKVEGVRPRGRPNKTLSRPKVIEKIARCDQYAMKMLWTVENGES